MKLLLKSTTNADGITGAVPVTGVTNPITLDESANWQGGWSNLPVSRNTTGSGTGAGTSQIIYYSVVEVKDDGSAVTIPQYLSPTYDYTAGGTGGVKKIGNIEFAVYGNVLDPMNTQHAVEVTNELDSVKVNVEKKWEDYKNLYGSRPDSITFTLQRKLKGSSDNYTNMTDADGNILQKSIVSGGLDDETQTVSFEGLPRCNAEGTEYLYRVLETGYEDEEGQRQTSIDSENETSGSFTTSDVEYTYVSSTSTIDGGYKTTITNTLEIETITFEGSVEWVDESNLYDVRPDDLEMTVYYRDSNGDWAVYDSNLYRIVWNKLADSNLWNYEVVGLIKYFKGTNKGMAYGTALTEPTYYKQVQPYKVTNNPIGISIGTADALTRNISRADFQIKLDIGAKLAVSKTRDRGRTGDLFEFKVYASDNQISSDNQGTLYQGDYEVYSIDDTTYSTVLNTKQTSDGKIEIEADQTFLIKTLPLGFYYSVTEVESRDYQLMTDEADCVGQLAINNTDAALVAIENHGYALLAISNETANPGEGSGNKENVGGKVTVVTETAQEPDQPSLDDYKPDSLAVAWQPDTYWVFGDSFSIIYTTFDGDEGKITIADYLNSDGTLKALVDCTVIEDDLGDFDTFIQNGAFLSWQEEGSIIRLDIAGNAKDMPYETKVTVEFTPTLAVSNVTSGSVSGKVKIENGVESATADGVPAYNGTPYPGATVVYATADTGYQVAAAKLAVRNMNDINGNAVLLNVNADGTFSVMLPTVLGGRSINVNVSGRVEYTKTDGVITGVKIILDELPIPLQFDMVFSEIPEPDPTTESTTESTTETTTESTTAATTESTTEGGKPASVEDGTTQNTNNNSDSAKTGDYTSILGLLVVMLMSGAMLVILRRRKFKGE